MRSLTLDFSKRKLLERETPAPVVAHSSEVLLRVREVGICGTDRELAAFHFGRPPEPLDYLILGHEALAEIDGTGELVVPMIRHACSLPCAQCAAGRQDLCTTGGYTERGIFGEHGYFAEFAVDREQDLVRVPSSIAEVAVLAEPLSVVEKAVALAFRLHIAEPRTALVLGAGTIGLLAAMVLRLRGLDVQVCSIEPLDSPRARMVRNAGAEYVLQASRPADIIIEAAGSGDAARAGLAALAPLGVLIVLGAHRSELSLLDLIVGNRIIAGSVNASPQAFREAVADLALMPRSVLSSMIDRRPFRDFASSLEGPPPATPKIVHVIE